MEIQSSQIQRCFFIIKFVVFSGLISVNVNAQTLQFSVTNGEEERCAIDSLIEILITPNPDKVIEELRVFWGDGLSLVDNMPNSPILLTHPYPGPGTLTDCSYPQECIDFGITGFCFDLRAIIRYTDGSTENNTKTLTFQVPPRPDFVPDIGYICANQQFCLDNLTCPDNDPNIIYNWSLPDGSTSTETAPCISLPTSGTYPITLTATNECGTASKIRNITVHALPMASAVVDSGSVTVQNDVYIVCLTDGGKIRLNSDASTNATTYEWTISPAIGSGLIGADQDTACANFTSPGPYTATLTVDNPCNAPSQVQLQIEVIPAISLSLESQDDECLTLNYSPTPLLDDATYELNGMIYTSTDFPIPLMESTEPYILTATVSNICDTLIQRDTFFVFGPFDPMITSPAMDTTICRDTTFLLLETNGLGNNWQVDMGASLVVQNGQTFFDPDQANGEYVISYAQGFGACEGSDTRTITIQSPDVTIDGPWKFCEGGDADTLIANLPGGIWSGEGIVDPMLGIYDPGIVTPGTFNVFYTYNDASFTGCTVTVTSTVEVVALPSANNVPTQFSVCATDVEFLLPGQMGVTFEPDSGSASWSGMGIVNTSTGAYNPSIVAGSIDTVSFIYTLDPGCTVEDIIFITIDSFPEVDAGPDLTICDNENNPILTATPTGQGRWLGTGIDEMTGEIDLSALTAGQTYEYIYIINEGFAPCTNSDTVDLTLENGQGVTVNPDVLYVCDTASILVLPTGNPASGSWEGVPGINGNMLDLTGLMPDTFSLFYVDSSLPAACNSAELTIYFAAQPEVEIISDSTTCVSVDCLEVLAQTNGAEAFRWQFGDGTMGAGAQICHTYEEMGLFQVSLTGYLINPMTNELYCASPEASTDIEVLGTLSEVSIIASDDSECPDFYVDLGVSNIDNNNTYSWTLLNIVDSVVTNLSDVLLPASTEDTTYVAVLSTSNGCDTQLDSMNLIARAPLRAHLATDFDSPCSGDTVILYNRSTGTSGNTPQWIISNGINFSGFEPPAFPVFTDDLPTILDVILIDQNECNSDTAHYTIEIQPTDVRARMNYSSESICAGADLELINISTPGAPVHWVTSDGNNYLGDTIIHRFMQLGLAWVTIYAEGCGFDSLRYEFEVLPPPDLSLDFAPFVCAEEEQTFAIGGNASGQTLYYGNGDSTFLNNSTYAYSLPGSYQLRLIGISMDGCQDSITASITVGDLPEAVVAPTDSLCVGEPVALLSQSIDAESCVWQLGDGGTRDDCLNSYIFNNSGIQNNRLIVTSSLGCKDSIDFPVYVRPTPVAAFSYQGSNDCSPAEVSFFYTNTTPTPTSWAWDLGDLTTSIEPNPVHTYDFGGAYTVGLIVGIDGICFDTLIQEIPVRGTPRFDTLVVDDRCLPSEAFVLEVITDAENEISLSGEDFFQVGINRFEIIPAGDYHLEILAPSGCDTTLDFTVPEVFPLFVELMPDTTILLGSSVRITSQVNASDLDFTWFPLDGLLDASLLEPIAKPGETTVYTLTVSDGFCTAADTVTIFVDEDVKIYFPNVFSPNDDGINDKYAFYPAIGVEKIRYFRIFDRWGQLVYKAENLEPTLTGVITWDGEIRGPKRKVKPFNSNTFVYVADLLLTNNKTILKKGSIHLLR